MNCYTVTITNIHKTTQWFDSVEAAGMRAYSELTARARYPRRGYTNSKGEPIQPIVVWVYNEKDQPVERMWITGDQRGQCKVRIESYNWGD